MPLDFSMHGTLAPQALDFAHLGTPVEEPVGAAFAQGQAHTLIPGAESAPAPVREPQAGPSGVPGAILAGASAIPAAAAGNVRKAIDLTLGADPEQADAGAREVAGKLSYEPSPAGAAALDVANRFFDKSKLGGLNPAASEIPAAAQVAGNAGRYARTATATGAGELAEGLAAAREAKAATAAPKVAILNRAKDEGFTLLPTATRSTGFKGRVNSLLEGYGGKIKTAQQVSEANAPKTNAIVGRNFGAEEPLVPTTINEDTGAAEGPMLDIRRNAVAQGYEPIKAIGPMQAEPGDKLFSDLDALRSQSQSAAKGFPASEVAKDEITPLVEGLKQPVYDSGSTVDMIGVLRKKATKAGREGDTTMAGAYRGAANAFEDFIERHLDTTGQTDLLKNFRDARTTLAQASDVTPALTPGGDVNATKLAQRGANTQKAPLTGDLRTVSDFAREQPKAMQPVGRIGGVTDFSPLDTAAAVIAKPSFLGAIVGRPLARKLVTSPGYQRMFVQPEDYKTPGLVERLARTIAGSGEEGVPQVEGAYHGGVAYQPPNLAEEKAANLSLGDRGPAGNEVSYPYPRPPSVHPVERAIAGEATRQSGAVEQLIAPLFRDLENERRRSFAPVRRTFDPRAQ